MAVRSDSNRLMARLRWARLAVVFAACTGTGAAWGAPLVADAFTEAPAAVESQEAATLDLGASVPDLRLDLAAELPLFDGAIQSSTERFVRRDRGRNGTAQTQSSGLGLQFDPASADLARSNPVSAQALRDTLRSYLNVPVGAAPAEPSSQPGRGRGSDPSDRIDIGQGASDWLHEALQGVMTGILRRDVNERGEASFSLFGLGEFNLTLSGDGRTVTLSAGDASISTTTRAEDRGGRTAGAVPDSGSRAYVTEVPIGAAGAQRFHLTADDVFDRMLEISVNLATHPLTLLALALAVAYGILVQVMSNRARRRTRHRRHMHEPDPSALAEQPKRSRSRRRHSRHQSESPSTQRA